MNKTYPRRLFWAIAVWNSICVGLIFDGLRRLLHLPYWTQILACGAFGWFFCSRWASWQATKMARSWGWRPPEEPLAPAGGRIVYLDRERLGVTRRRPTGLENKPRN